MTKLVLTIEPNRSSSVVRVRIQAGETIAPALRVVQVTYNGKTVRLRRQPESAAIADFATAGGTQSLEIDFGGPMPAGAIIFPEQATGITSPLPQLLNDATGQLESRAQIWHPEHSPMRLKTLVSSLFAYNAHLAYLPCTFAGLTELREVPESLFFPLIYAKSFAGTFMGTGLTKVSRQMFAANGQAEDFSHCFANCTSLKEVPEDLFAANRLARNFESTFEASALQKIPAGLFRNTRKKGLFVRTFAATFVREVPAALMRDLAPLTVDGMFEPLQPLEHDPLRLKAGPVFSEDFFADTRTASGVPTLSADAEVHLL